MRALILNAEHKHKMAEAVYQIVFFIFTIGLLGSAAMVVFMRNPVRCILFLVLAFFCSAVLWMLLQAEFLSLVLIFVYVGAVMTLFLFVVMMLNIDLAPLKEGFVKYLPIGMVVLILMIGLMCYALTRNVFNQDTMLVQHGPQYNNVVALGTELFTNYIYEFELAGFILLSAMVAAISLAFYGRKPGTKAQNMTKQLQANKASGLRIVKMKTESQ